MSSELCFTSTPCSTGLFPGSPENLRGADHRSNEWSWQSPIFRKSGVVNRGLTMLVLANSTWWTSRIVGKLGNRSSWLSAGCSRMRESKSHPPWKGRGTCKEAKVQSWEEGRWFRPGFKTNLARSLDPVTLGMTEAYSNSGTQEKHDDKNSEELKDVLSEWIPCINHVKSIYLQNASCDLFPK